MVKFLNIKNKGKPGKNLHLQMISSKLARLVEAKECLAIAVDTVVELSQVLRPHLLLEVGWGTRLSGTERCAVISLTNSSGDDFCNRRSWS